VLLAHHPATSSWGAAGLATVEGNVKSLLHQTLADVFHCLDTAVECFGYPLVCPVCAFCISLEQDLSAPYFLAAAAQGFDDGLKLLALFGAEANDVFFRHGAWSRSISFTLIFSLDSALAMAEGIDGIEFGGGASGDGAEG